MSSLDCTSPAQLLTPVTVPDLEILFLLERMGAVRGWARAIEDWAPVVQTRGSPEAITAFQELRVRLEKAQRHEDEFGEGSFLKLDHYLNIARYPHSPSVRKIYARYSGDGLAPNSQASLNSATASPGSASLKTAAASSAAV